MKKLKVLIVSDNPLKATGFGRQARDIHKMLTGLGHEVMFIGMHSQIQGNGTQQYEGSTIFAMQGPMGAGGQWRDADRHWLQGNVLREKPDLILLVWDLRKLAGIVADFDRFFRCPTYLYWLFDAYPISHQYIEPMKSTRIRILPITKCISKWLDDAGIIYDFRSIPEPVDPTKFYPMPEETRKHLKIKYLGDYADKVCFGYVGGSFQRKNVPFLLDAFARLPSEIIEDSVMFLHTDPGAFAKNPQHYDMHGIIDAYYPHLKDRIIFSQANNDVSFNMAEIYNVMDFQASASIGEGWGLPTVEGLACGVPMIIGDISTTMEIMGSRESQQFVPGYIVPISGHLYSPNPYLRHTIPDLKQFINAMQAAYQDVRSGLDYNTRALSRSSLFHIDKVQALWGEFIGQIDDLGWSDQMVDEPMLIKDAGIPEEAPNNV